MQCFLLSNHFSPHPFIQQSSNPWGKEEGTASKRTTSEGNEIRMQGWKLHCLLDQTMCKKQDAQYQWPCFTQQWFKKKKIVPLPPNHTKCYAKQALLCVQNTIGKMSVVTQCYLWGQGDTGCVWPNCLKAVHPLEFHFQSAELSFLKMYTRVKTLTCTYHSTTLLTNQLISEHITVTLWARWHVQQACSSQSSLNK